MLQLQNRTYFSPTKYERRKTIGEINKRCESTQTYYMSTVSQNNNNNNIIYVPEERLR